MICRLKLRKNDRFFQILCFLRWRLRHVQLLGPVDSEKRPPETIPLFRIAVGVRAKFLKRKKFGEQAAQHFISLEAQCVL